MRFTVRVRGRGRVRIAAYGVADAEHLVEKELRRLWPEARARIEEIARAEAAGPRIVEEFDVSYRLEGLHEVAAPNPEDAPAAAFRHLRGLLASSRYRKTEWDGKVVKSE